MRKEKEESLGRIHKNSEGGEETACNWGTFVRGLLQGIQHHLTALNLPSLSASEVGIFFLSLK